MLCSSSSIERVMVVKAVVEPLGLLALVASSSLISSVSSGSGSSDNGV